MFKKSSSQSGFTLIETLVAILILSLSVTALLALTAGGFFSVRYARNQIIADALAQESLEYIRNSVDSAMIQGLKWEDWLTKMNIDVDGNEKWYDPASPNAQGCFDEAGCIVDPYVTDIKHFEACNGECMPIAFFPSVGFYGYEKHNYPFSPIIGYNTSYIRRINVQQIDIDQMLITVRIQWLNGSLARSNSQSIVITNWRTP